MVRMTKKNNMPKLFSNQAGQGLVSVLVAAAVGAIVLGFMTDMMLQQDSGQKFLRQRITLNDLNSNLLSTFSNASGCTCQFANNGVINPNFANYAGLKFDSTVVDGSQRMPIKTLYTGCLGGANAPQILAKENTALLMSPDIIVDKVELAKLRPTGALNEWQGQWEISFKVGIDSLKRSAKPINVTQKFLIDTTAPNSPAAAVITSCVGSSTGAGTTNYLAKWSAVTGVLQDSGIFEASPSGNVGIGTTAPTTGTRLDIDGTGAAASSIIIPRDTVANRPTVGVNGMIRYASDSNKFEAYENGGWTNMVGGWSLTGNAVTIAGTNFIGTTDNNDVVFKRNGVQSGLLNASSKNTSWGVGALKPATTGNNNTANGYFALASNTTGSDNTANGYLALPANTTGSDNTANGYLALPANRTGNNNTANGAQSLNFNNSGSNNTANGGFALASNTTGNNNTANGYMALSNTTGNNSTANGYQALASNTTGVGNTADGYQALYFNTTGGNNTANGSQALRSNSTGNNNTANGYLALTNSTGNNNTANGSQALASNTTGSHNVSIGANAGSLQAGGAALQSANNSIYIGSNTRGFNNSDNNSIVIGDSAIGIGVNSVVLGNDSIATTALKGKVGVGTTSPQTALQVAGVISPATNNTYTLGNATYRFTEVYATNGVINTSDRREKKDIYNTDLGLDFINKLRPVSYRWNTGVDDDVHYGLIAQEAEQVVAEVGKSEKTSIVTHDETTDRYGVRYSELISPLIKAAQELYSRLIGVESHQSNQDREIASVKAEKADKTQVNQLKSENEKLKQEGAAKTKEMAEIKARLDKIEKALKFPIPF